jgi:hypothetical protein
MLKAKRRFELTMLPQEILFFDRNGKEKGPGDGKRDVILKHAYPCQEI